MKTLVDRSDHRYYSGLAVSGVPDAGAALGLTPNQQVTLGLACNGVYATVATPLSNCVNPNGTMGSVTSKLITLPQGGYGNFPSLENDDHNPDRVKPGTFSIWVAEPTILCIGKGLAGSQRRWISIISPTWSRFTISYLPLAGPTSLSRDPLWLTLGSFSKLTKLATISAVKPYESANRGNKSGFAVCPQIAT